MERTDFSEHRVLLVGAKTHTLQLLRSLLGTAGVGKVIHVEEARRALELLSMEHFHAVFYDDRADEAEEKPFCGGAAR